MIIDCIGCLHGARPNLEGGDLLIITGDLTANDTFSEYSAFMQWVWEQNYSKKIFIAGNHDNELEPYLREGDPFVNSECEYLCDSGTEFGDLKIWGSPWTSRFEGINPNCCAFTEATDKELYAHFYMIPPNVDILITHCPPFMIRDRTVDGFQVGSFSLMAMHVARFRPKLWAFSHIHEGYGQERYTEDGTSQYEWSHTRYVNCSIMNERSQPVNAPIRIILPN